MHVNAHQELFEAINEIASQEQNKITTSSEIPIGSLKAQIDFGQSVEFDQPTPEANRLKP